MYVTKILIMSVYINSNLTKTARHSEIFIRAIHIKYSKRISNPICCRMMILLNLFSEHFFKKSSKSRYNGNNYEIFVRIVHLFLNKSTNIIRD